MPQDMISHSETYNAETFKADTYNAESVGKLQPRVCFETLGEESSFIEDATLKELCWFCGRPPATQLLQSCD